jgi:hypothetical protein
MSIRRRLFVLASLVVAASFVAARGEADRPDG